MFNMGKKASGVMEYALALGVVSLALSGMFIYLKRGVQARVKDVTTSLIVKDLYERDAGEHQFVANQSKSDTPTELNSSLNQIIQGDATTSTVNETITRNSTENDVPIGWEDQLPE